jgi:hypothetical protein
VSILGALYSWLILVHFVVFSQDYYKISRSINLKDKSTSCREDILG